MPIARFNAPAMGKVDHVAIAAAPARLFDDAIGGRVDRLSGPSGHVDPGVHRRTAVEGIVADAEVAGERIAAHRRSEEHTSELQSLMRISYAVFCLKKKNKKKQRIKKKSTSNTRTTSTTKQKLITEL